MNLQKRIYTTEKSVINTVDVIALGSLYQPDDTTEEESLNPSGTLAGAVFLSGKMKCTINSIALTPSHRNGMIALYFMEEIMRCDQYKVAAPTSYFSIFTSAHQGN